MKRYKFRREDNGKIIVVPFEKMMEQDVTGCITLENGVVARRVHGADTLTRKGRREIFAGVNMPPSDAMGFTRNQLDDFVADRDRHGFTGVEFVQDPTEPTFMQVKCSSLKERDRYLRHRGMVDCNRTAGCAITERDLHRAILRARSQK